ncbi:MAG: glycosyltransferase family 39 protein [Planctomycetia bacterium]|nr:glycosyltransferase family 39 protein [Planctomycetia bacterium]
MASRRAAVDLISVNAIPAIAGILVMALALRLGVLWKYSSHLQDDHDNYRRIAQEVALWKGCVDPDTAQPTAYRPPLYPWLLAIIIYCGGHDVAIGIVHALLGVATVALAMDVGRRLGLGRGSFIAGALVAVDPLLLYQTVQVMTETTAAFLAGLCLWLFLRPATTVNGLAIGLVFGAACLCRPTFWAFGALATACWLVVHIRSIDWLEGFSDGGLRPAVVVVAGVLTVIGPWMMRNSKLLRSPVITTTHGGYTLLLPHNDFYTRDVVQKPWGTVWPSASFDEWTVSVEGQLATINPPLDRAHLWSGAEVARDDWMNRQALRYIRNDPRTALRSGLTLLGRMWSIAPATTGDASRSTALRVAIGVFYVPVLVAMLVGMFRVATKSWKTWWPPLVLILGFTCVHALYWADMRMRAPLVPAIALLATASCITLKRSSKGRPRSN